MKGPVRIFAQVFQDEEAVFAVASDKLWAHPWRRAFFLDKGQGSPFVEESPGRSLRNGRVIRFFLPCFLLFDDDVLDFRASGMGDREEGDGRTVTVALVDLPARLNVLPEVVRYDGCDRLCEGVAFVICDAFDGPYLSPAGAGSYSSPFASRSLNNRATVRASCRNKFPH